VCKKAVLTERFITPQFQARLLQTKGEEVTFL